MVKKFDPSPFISKVGKPREKKNLLKGFDRSQYQSAFRNPDETDYKETICRALSIPFELEDGKIYHHLGVIDASTSAEAINAVVYASKVYLYTYLEYLDAIKRLGRIQGQLDAIEKHRQREDERWAQFQQSYDPEKPRSFHERPEPEPPPQRDVDFLDIYHMETHTHDLDGYKQYIQSMSPEVYRAIRKPIPFYLEENPGKPHGYVLGTSGSGKSELLKLLIHTYVTNKHYGSVVVIDPASDFVTQIAKWKEFNTSDRLVYIRPTLFRGKVPCINPFQIHGIRATDYSEEALNVKRVVAQELVEALGRIVTEGGGFITAPMRTILTNCVLVLLDKDGATLEDLSRFMKDNKELLAFGSSLNHHEYIAKYFTEKDSGFTSKGNYQTKEAIGRRMDDLLSVGTFRKLTCGESTVDLESAIGEKKVVLFDLGKGAIGKREGSAFGRLIIAMLMGMAFRRENRVPCSIVIDECHNFVSQSMEEILTEARKFKMYLTMAQQTAGQRMPPELRDAVLENTSLQIVGGTSPAGAKRNADMVGVTADDIRKLGIGEFYVRAHRADSPIKFKTRNDLLDWKNCVSPPTWKRILAEQEQYYTQPIAPEEQAVDEDVEWDYTD